MSSVRWESWSPETFERARREDKPVLLSISAVWCHWCHVMDDSTYSDAAVAQKIRDLYVPVRVDNDVRPDVNARYNMGGWPTTAFLTPDGMTITGGTYMPPEQMLCALDEIAGFYAANKDGIAQRSAELREARKPYEPAERNDLTAAMARGVTEQLAQSYDPLYGGFGTDMKFPQTEALELLALEHRITGDAEPLEMLANTLRHMASGGTYDREEGGFFRYSTTRDWSIPHVEKMSDDHAGLLRALSELQMLAPQAWIAQTLRSATGYIRTAWRDSQTAFFAGSQDADEAYYAQPLAVRKTMQAPFIDRRSYSNWTAALAGSFFAVADALDDDSYASEAVAPLDAMHEKLHDESGLLYHVFTAEDGPSVRGLVGDQAAYLRALLDAHEYTGEPRFLERAVAHADLVQKYFAADDGGYYDHARMENQLGNLTISDRPIDQNGLLADALLRLCALTDEPRFRDQAERALLLYAKTFKKAGSFAAPYARALYRYLSPETTLRIVGKPTETATLRKTARTATRPFINIRTQQTPVIPSEASTASEVEGQSHPTAFVCHGTVCSAPITDAAGLRQMLVAPQPRWQSR
jgi:uncharacterized protein YyaL (SSP411 family)